MIGEYGLISLLVYVLVGGLILYLIYWVLGRLGLPEPLNTIVIVVLVIIAILLLLGLLRSSGLF